MSSQRITKGLRVRAKVLLKANDQEIEKSVVEYIQGGGTMLPGLEKRLDGMAVGGVDKGILKAIEAFGNPAASVEKRISKDEFPAEAEFKKGARFAAKGPSGDDVFLEVLEVADDDIAVRFLHPLADTDIHYEIEVLSVTDPKPPPLPAEAIAIEDE